ncbi:hypothetical protein SAMD00019534_118430 [Acytostelium subglobosum LB1]|uniref:hypothetical protein n=1 Tax=Acytostelium subglobosum LB1 TaxID=1410327 RepID=UPI000644D288|nr:hypothetical protein SAMD00019534_118430 [Acytostelium subglobosum LB1]GAM28667.1 hypothetical protein SAMD00019534_118430 [Acytostelium subglobosum LB1]|eukprot:XP_012748445.1 hypothetical protein SAMD00019534_118430 [Acytostelium subglobosum LB1]
MSSDNFEGGDDPFAESDTDSDYEDDLQPDSEQDEDNVDFYAILNVPRDASASEIQVAYKKLAFTYHPDKQTNEELKAQSQHKFALISRAKETLCDEKSRAIYDRYGVSGLNNSRSLINRYEEVDNLLRAFGRIQRTMKEERVLDYFNGHGYQSMTIAYHPEYNFIWLNKFVSSQTFKLNTPIGAFEITPAFTKKRIDSEFRCSGTYSKTLFNRVQLVSSLHYSDRMPLVSNIALKTMLTKSIRGQIACSNILPHVIPADLQVSLHKHFSQTVESKLTTYFTMGSATAILKLTRNVENRILDLEVAASNTFGFRSSITRHLPISKKTNMSVSIGTSNLSFGGITAAITRRISKVLRVTFSMQVSPSKYLYTLGFQHKYQSFDIPIPIYANVGLVPSLIFFTVPSLLFTGLKLLIVNPLLRRRELEQIKTRKEKHSETYKEARSRASIDIQLMRPTVDKKAAVEQAKNGLVIQQALYGVLKEHSASADVDYPATIDVTIPLQYLVEDSKLELHPNKKSDLIGFYDPRVGEEKQLKVTYLFQGQLHMTIVNDNELLRIPVRSHLIK